MWANIGKGFEHHVTLLQQAFEEKSDVVCIQEPWTGHNSRTQSHPGFDLYTPVDNWGNDDLTLREKERPRVLTYVRRGAGLKTQQKRPVQSRDLLWVEVNGFSILNVYRISIPGEMDEMDYVIGLQPLGNCLVGGDLNAQVFFAKVPSSSKKVVW